MLLPYALPFALRTVERTQSLLSAQNALLPLLFLANSSSPFKIQPKCHLLWKLSLTSLTPNQADRIIPHSELPEKQGFNFLGVVFHLFTSWSPAVDCEL